MLIDCTLRTEKEDHWSGQAETGKRIKDIVGRDNARWIGGQGLSTHTWRVKCTSDELIVLTLVSEKVSQIHQTRLIDEAKRLKEEIATKLLRIAEIEKQIGEI